MQQRKGSNGQENLNGWKEVAGGLKVKPGSEGKYSFFFRRG